MKNYLNYTVVNGQIVHGSQTTIDGFSTFQSDGNIWSLDGPALGFLCSIVAVFVNQAEARIAYDPRPIGSYDGDVKITAWGYAVKQDDGRYAIQLS